jgi:nucleoside-diphosphate-sugar epimerase
MRVFVAGAAGAIGVPLAARLLAAGHEVTGTTRDAGRADELRARGVEPVILEAFDREAVVAAVTAARPDVVIHQLTSLPVRPDPKSMSESMDRTTRLRRDTVPYFLDAARAAGARRILVQSISFATRPGDAVQDEQAPLWTDAPGDFRAMVQALDAMERATVEAQGIEGLVLRYGFFYGPRTWYHRDGAIGEMVRRRRYPVIGGGRGRQSFVHVDDAADATVLALDHGGPGIYNITDDEPAPTREWVPEAARVVGAKRPFPLPAWLARRLAGDVVVHYATGLSGNSNAKAKAALGWQPRSWREGFREVFAT